MGLNLVVKLTHLTTIMHSYVDIYNYHSHHTYKTQHENVSNNIPCPNHLPI